MSLKKTMNRGFALFGAASKEDPRFVPFFRSLLSRQLSLLLSPFPPFFPIQNSRPARFAFFDLDQTLVPYDLQLLFGNWIVRRHPLRRAYLLFFLLALPFRKLLGTATLKRCYLSLLHGMTSREVQAEAKAFVDHYFPALFYPEVLSALRAHQAQGDHVILSSASPLFYVALIAEVLDITEVYGTQVVLADQMPFMPALDGGNNKSEEKIRRLKDRFLAAGWEWDLPLPSSVSYTDSTADLPLLRIARRAVLIHPSPSLAAQTAITHPGRYEIMRPNRVSKKTLIGHFVLLFFGLFPLTPQPTQSAASFASSHPNAPER